MIIVLDTNVLVSGLLTPFGSSGEILRMVSAGELLLCYDARILAEYREVLLRPRFLFDPEHVATLLEHIRHVGHSHATSPLPGPLPDPDDEPFLEVAISGKVCCLVTGNASHYPTEQLQGVKIFSPTAFLEHRRRSK